MSEPRVSVGLEPPKPEGMIKIGTPQVYSRQLVFRDRSEEIQYLSDRLKSTTKYNASYQGIVDARTYQALGLQMALSLNPQAGKVADQSTLNQVQTLESQMEQNELAAEVKKLNLQIEMEKAKQALEALQKNGTQPPAGGTVTLDEATKTQISNLDTQIKALSTKIEALEKTGVPTVAGVANRVKPGLPTDPAKPSTALDTGGTEAKTTTATITPIEQEKAVLEVRRFLQNERRRLSFDDMHDGAGAVAVDLGMLVSLIPPKNRDAYAVVEAHVEDVRLCDCEDKEKMENAFAQTLLSALAAERHYIEERLASGALPLGERYFDIALRQLQTEAGAGEALAKPMALEPQLPPSGKGLVSPFFRNGVIPLSAPDVERLRKLPSMSTNQFSADFRRRVNEVDLQAKAAPVADATQEVAPPAPAVPEVEKEVERNSMDRFMEEILLTIIPASELPSPGSPTLDVKTKNKYLEKLLNRYMQIYWTEEFGKYAAMRKSGGGGGDGSWSGKEVVYVAPGQSGPTQMTSGGKVIVGKLKDGPLDLTLEDLKRVAKNAIEQFEVRDRSRVRVLAVDPADQGQNISSVGASQTITDLTFAISAALAQGASGSGRMDSYTENRLYLQSANRKPLAVGFVDGGGELPSFGWVLGPRFEMQMKRGFPSFWSKKPVPAFAHEPTQHQVQVSVGLASWTPELRVHTKSWWVDKKTGRPATAVHTTSPMPVKLLPDYSAMTEGLLDCLRGRRRPPRLFIGNREERFILSSQGSVHKLALVGKDMWRSPAVYLDSLPAKSVEVMPGLVGVVATFEGDLPASNDDMYDLTVSTTDGFDIIYNRVVVPELEEEAAPAPNPGQVPSVRLGLQQPVIKHPFNDNGELVIPLTLLENPFPMLPPQSLLAAKCFPLGLYDRMVDARPQTGMNNTLTLVVGKSAEPLLKSVPGLELTSPSGKPASALMSFTVTMQVMNPQAGLPEARDVVTGNRQVLLVDPKRCLFTAQEGLKFTLGDVEQELRLLFPDQVLADHFKLAYPDLVTAALAGTVKLELVDAEAVTRVYATLAMKGPATDVAQGLYFRVPPRTDAAFFNGLTLDPTKDTTRTKSFVLRLSYGSTYEKVGKTVTLEVPLKPAS
ncbi:MAG TPA: hypothetical protein DCP71_16730 [Verrucomicrobiales bacterium]|nr:hypothetical protein [Verrucomicrobiales bacterium]